MEHWVHHLYSYHLLKNTHFARKDEQLPDNMSPLARDKITCENNPKYLYPSIHTFLFLTDLYTLYLWLSRMTALYLHQQVVKSAVTPVRATNINFIPVSNLKHQVR